MPETIQLPRVTVTGQRAPTNDTVAIVVKGRRWEGWTAVRITRGIERIPSDFEVQMTEFAPGSGSIEILRGDKFVLMIGADAVLTGYVDRIVRSFDAHRHTVTVSGRSKCQDLVDCSAEWPGGQIVGASVFDIATKLAAPYGIEVTGIGDMGPQIPQFNLARGETPFQIIERLCRFGQLLAYDDVNGDLVLSAVSTRRAASGFREGVNVKRATHAATIDQRFSEYLSFMQSMATLDDLGPGGDLQAIVTDEEVPRHRRRILICETSGGVGWEIAQDRAKWEGNRRRGRSAVVTITTDSWRDRSGALYTPNTVAHVELPTLKVAGSDLTIGEVTYRLGDEGTTCELTMMPSIAFTPQPFNVLQLLPFAELAGISANAQH